MAVAVTASSSSALARVSAELPTMGGSATAEFSIVSPRKPRMNGGRINVPMREAGSARGSIRRMRRAARATSGPSRATRVSFTTVAAAPAVFDTA
jgi:hypothetical protein